MSGLVMIFNAIWLTSIVAHYSDASDLAISLIFFAFTVALFTLGCCVNRKILFYIAIAIFAVALVAGRLKVQSSEAGGNAAAARGRS